MTTQETGQQFEGSALGTASAQTGAQKYADRLKQLEDLRNPFEQDWLDIQKYILPRKGLFYLRGQKVKEKRDHSAIIDPEATFDLKDLAAALLTGMTPKTRPWLRLVCQDRDVMDYAPAKAWFHYATQIMLDSFAWSNLYNALHSTYKESAAFGTGCMIQEEDFEALFRFKTYTTGEYFLAVNERGEVDVFYRRYEITARNIIDTFGEDAVSTSVKTAANDHKTQDKYFTINHAIQPNMGREWNKIDNLNMPYESVYWESKSRDQLLSRSGFEEFPVFAPRWDVTSNESIYGESPSRDVLGHVKMLQEMNIGQVKGMHKELEPPMRIPAQFKGRLSLIPGAQNIDPDPSGKGISSLYDINFDYRGITEKIEDVRNQLQRGYFVDLLKMIAARPGLQPPTATEVAERHEEKVILLSPILERFHTDLLNPLIKRSFNIMLRNGVLPEPPPEIQGERIKVEYTSLLAQTQKLMGLAPIETYLGFLGSASGLNPAMLDKVDFDEMAEEFADASGVPPKIILSDETVRAIRDARAKQQQQMQSMEQAAALVEGVKGLGQSKTKDSALGELIEGMSE